jgi:hypothetical protein
VAVSIAASKFGVGTAWSAALVAVFALLALMIRVSAPRHALFALLLMAAIVPLSDGAARAFLSRDSGARLSTKSLSLYLASPEVDQECRVSFFEQVPFSARFYFPDRIGPTLRGTTELKSIGDESACRLVAVNRNRMKRFEAAEPNDLSPLRAFGPYTLFGNAHFSGSPRRRLHVDLQR